MKDFWGSLRFKILAAILIVLLGFMIMAVYTGGTAPLFSRLAGFVITPVQRLSAGIAGGVSDFFDKYFSAGKVYENNAELREEITMLREQLADYEAVKHENEQLREILGVKDIQYADREMQTAAVIARDPSGWFYSFSIDKGSMHGIKVHDPVITADGLVGYVTEVGANFARVSTILDAAVNVGAYDSASRDIGIVSGTVELAAQGLCRMQYLPRESVIADGNLILTGGGGLFPRDLIIGKVLEVGTGSHGTSLEAVVEPAAEIRTVKNVFVITYFEGQGSD